MKKVAFQENLALNAGNSTRDYKALLAKCGLSIFACAYLTACSHTQPGVEVRIVERIVETAMPCAAEFPERPLPFVRPTGEGLEALAAALAAKLAEYSAEGKFADQAMAYFEACPPAE